MKSSRQFRGLQSFYKPMVVWRSGSVLVLINKVNLRREGPVSTGMVNMPGFNSQCRTFISLCNQPPRSTLPGHPFVGRHIEYHPKGGDTLRLESKGRCGWVAGKTV